MPARRCFRPAPRHFMASSFRSLAASAVLLALAFVVNPTSSSFAHTGNAELPVTLVINDVRTLNTEKPSARASPAFPADSTGSIMAKSSRSYRSRRFEPLTIRAAISSRSRFKAASHATIVSSSNLRQCRCAASRHSGKRWRAQIASYTRASMHHRAIAVSSNVSATAGGL